MIDDGVRRTRLDLQALDLTFRPHPCFFWAEERGFVSERADDNLANIEQDTLVQHEAIAPAVRGHQAHAAARGFCSASWESAPVRVRRHPGSRLTDAEQDSEKRRHAGAFEASQTHHFARASREANIGEFATANAFDAELLWRPNAARREGWRK